MNRRRTFSRVCLKAEHEGLKSAIEYLSFGVLLLIFNAFVSKYICLYVFLPKLIQILLLTFRNDID